MNRQELKHQARRFLDAACATSGILRLHEARMRAGLTVLMYHRVLPPEICADYPLESLVMPVDAFRTQVAWLAHHARVLPVAEALDCLRAGPVEGKPLVAITFDDGYADNYEHAAGILEAHRVRGTFFVATGFIERGIPFWFDRAADAWIRIGADARTGLLARLLDIAPRRGPASVAGNGLATWMGALKRLPVGERDRWVEEAQSLASGELKLDRYRAMSRDQLVELDRRGHEIASHGIDHPILPLLDAQSLEQEMTGSRATLSNWLGHEIAGFCYPNGDSDTVVVAAARAAGYRYACATSEGINAAGDNTFQLKRRPVAMSRVFGPGGGHSLLGFRSEVCGLRERWR